MINFILTPNQAYVRTSTSSPGIFNSGASTIGTLKLDINASLELVNL